jgi:hypothetical protein
MCALEIVVVNDGNVLSIPSDWLPDNAPDDALAFRRWYVIVAGLSAQPHSIGFREPMPSARTIPVSFLNRNRPAGRLRRQLLLSGEPFGSRVSDYALSFTFRGFDTHVALHRAAAAAFYPRPAVGDIVVADVLIKIFLFLPIEHLTLVAVSAVSRAWRAARRTCHSGVWCLRYGA